MIDALLPQIEGPAASQLRAPYHGGMALLLVCLLPSLAVGQGTESDAALPAGTIQDPVFCPSNPELVAYSRQEGDTQELYLYDTSAGTVRQITAVAESGTQDEDAEDFFEGGSERELDRFEGELAWRPLRDPEGRQWFVFVSSASKTGYGLFLSYLTPDGKLADRIVELPFEGQATAPAWSPNGLQLVFSGSPEGVEGNELFLHPILRPFLRAEEGEALKTPAPVPLTESAGSLYPDWAPSGEYIAYQSKRAGEDGWTNWGISLLDLSTWEGPQSGERPRSERLSGQLSAYHEYKPSWSPDGRYVAFYVSQTTVGASTGNHRQDIGVLRPVRGRGSESGWTGRILEGRTGQRLAQNVLPNESRGPEWHSSEALGASLIYVRKEENRGNPIYRADVRQWRSDSAGFLWRLSDQFEQETRLHEEVTAARAVEGLRLVFASQEGERLRLQLRDGLNPTYGKVKAGAERVETETGEAEAETEKVEAGTEKTEAETEKAEADTTRAASPKNCRIQFAAKKEKDRLLKEYKKKINKSLERVKAEIIKVEEERVKYKLVSNKKREGEKEIDRIIEQEIKRSEKFEKVEEAKPIAKCYQKGGTEL